MDGRKILVVEDDSTIAFDIQMNLKANGYKVIGPAHKVKRALAYLESEKIDLILLDINLAGELSGIDLAKIIDQKYDIPFIYLTSYSDSETVKEAAKTFPASYIVKPFKEDDISPAIEIALMRRKEGRNQKIPSLTLINKNIIPDLTETEYDILVNLWNGLSNAEIAENRFNSTNTIKTHIRNIYSKLQVHNRAGLMSFIRKLSR